MDIRRRALKVGESIRSVAAAEGVSMATVAKAADIPSSEIDERVACGDLGISELVNIGGLLRVSPSRFFEEVA